jgi:hypothetical protein
MDVSVVPVTVPVNCCVWPDSSEALVGEIDTETFVRLFVGCGVALLVALAVPVKLSGEVMRPALAQAETETHSMSAVTKTLRRRETKR